MYEEDYFFLNANKDFKEVCICSLSYIAEEEVTEGPLENGPVWILLERPHISIFYILRSARPKHQNRSSLRARRIYNNLYH